MQLGSVGPWCRPGRGSLITNFYPFTSTILCDNQAVIYNTQFPTSTLKKKHNAVAFHKLREAIAAGIIRTAYVKSENNLSDILTKPKGPLDYHNFLKVVLYGKSPKTEHMHQGE